MIDFNVTVYIGIEKFPGNTQRRRSSDVLKFSLRGGGGGGACANRLFGKDFAENSMKEIGPGGER